MTQLLKIRFLIIIWTMAFIAVVLCDGCTRKNNDKNCCEGYTGKLTDSNAVKLVARCHFISKDSILVWTNRYKESKGRFNRDSSSSVAAEKSAPDINFLKSDAYSFNSCIIRKLIGSEKSIGLRVLQGMSADKVVHVIFVGIQPDYSNLYIDEPEDCCSGNSLANLGAGVSGATGKSGGAEYGQIP